MPSFNLLRLPNDWQLDIQNSQNYNHNWKINQNQPWHVTPTFTIRCLNSFVYSQATISKYFKALTFCSQICCIETSLFTIQKYKFSHDEKAIIWFHIFLFSASVDNIWMCEALFVIIFEYTRSDNKVRKLATVCLPWQQWTETLVWFDDDGLSVFHSCVVDLWQSLSEWCLLLSKCVPVCRHENVRAWIRAMNEH
jgi:hypothetical protein